MSLVKYGKHVFILVSLTLLAPLSRLLAYNWDYFDISLVEIILGLVIASGLAVLVVLPAYFVRFLRGNIVAFLSIIFITAVFSVYIFPINLSAIDGGDRVGFEIRSEAFYAFMSGCAAFFIYLCGSLFGEPTLKKAEKAVKFLVMISAFYVLAFTVYGAFQAPSYLAFTGNQSENYTLPVSSEKNVFIIGFDQVQGSLMH